MRTSEPSLSAATAWAGAFSADAFSAAVARQILAWERSQSALLITKRLVDLLLGSVLLVLTAPITLAAMLLIRLTGPGSVLFQQERIGHRADSFRMLKLRTMRMGSEGDEQKLARTRTGRVFLKIFDDPRVTPLGRWLRRSSIDELPQLINVLRGQMSLVGPRPLLRCDLYRFPSGEQQRRFAMKPGLTGLWQVSGRSQRTDAERLELDLEYVDRWSPWLDIMILIRTVPAVVSGRGAM